MKKKKQECYQNLPPAVEVIRLTKSYPLTKNYRDLLLHPLKKELIPAIKDISFTVNRGEIFGLLGPNGAGKTTIIKILSTLVLPDSGKAIINGFDAEQDGDKVRRSIGYVIGEERSCFWRLTGRQNLEFFAVMNNMPKDVAHRQIEKLLDMLELTDAADRACKEYSTGMRQKLAIARGLLAGPDIIFLDEPTKSLDPNAARHLRNFIRNEIVLNGGKTVIFCTHNLNEAEDICDRLAIIGGGNIKAIGNIREIKSTYRSRLQFLIKTKVVVSQDMIDRIKNIVGSSNVISEEDKSSHGTAITLTTDHEKADFALSELIKNGILIHSFQCLEPSLEEIFARLTEYHDSSINL